jgi:hypothetical protein
MFHCGFDPQCPAVAITGDPISTEMFHGYGDPSLERDPGGALWLTFSWLDQETLPNSTSQLNSVRTHLATSTDGGASWTFVRAVNATAPAPGNTALVMHEVSTIARQPDGSWAAAWLTYGLIPPDTRAQFHYQRTLAATPNTLGDSITPWLRGSATTVTTQIDSSMIAGAESCIAFTEPALFTHAGTSYLATTCIVNPTMPATQRLILLRESGGTLSLVGELLTAADASELGGTRVEQIDLSIAKDDTILAIVTPIDDTDAVLHQGCVVLEVDDLATAHVRRDPAGHLVRRAVITGDGNGIGPGLCTYDRDSSTGVLIDLTSVGSGTIDFSLRATGIHP